MQSLYDFPAVYEAVMQRPRALIEREVDSLRALLARYSVTTGRILELACGTCPHGLLLVRAGFQVVGLDRSAAMLAEVQRRARATAVDIRTVKADVVDFELDAADFDAAIFMFETFPLITAYGDLASHFAALRRHLRMGGIYLVDIDAPRHASKIRDGASEWGRRSVALPNGSVEVWNEDLPGDWFRRTNHLVLHCRICLENKVFETRDDWCFRAYSPWDLELLTRALDGWDLEGCYSWQDPSTWIAGDDHYLAVFVAR